MDMVRDYPNDNEAIARRIMLITRLMFIPTVWEAIAKCGSCQTVFTCLAESTIIWNIYLMNPYLEMMDNTN